AGVPGHTGRSHRFDSFVAAMEAAKAGAGALLGSRPLIDTALAGKALVALSGFELSSSSGHFLTRASAAGLTQAEQDFRLWLLSRLAGIGAL
ncbi:LysR family transcriptional regulator, partial [Mesorhizobium sp. USDA-HM6]